MSKPKQYDIACPTLPNTGPPLFSCQAALDILPYGDELLRFGAASDPHAQVQLPNTFDARRSGCAFKTTPGLVTVNLATGRCRIEITYNGYGSTTSWNDINNAVAAMINQVSHCHRRHTQEAPFRHILHACDWHTIRQSTETEDSVFEASQKRVQHETSVRALSYFPNLGVCGLLSLMDQSINSVDRVGDSRQIYVRVVKRPTQSIVA